MLAERLFSCSRDRPVARAFLIRSSAGAAPRVQPSISVGMGAVADDADGAGGQGKDDEQNNARHRGQ
jgi:hypothetical protein